MRLLTTVWFSQSLKCSSRSYVMDCTLRTVPHSWSSLLKWKKSRPSWRVPLQDSSRRCRAPRWKPASKSWHLDIDMVAELLTQVMDESIEKKIEFILYLAYYVNVECIGSYILSGTLNVNRFVIINLFKINKTKLIVFYPLFPQKGSENSAASYHRSCTHRNCHCLADGSAHHRSSHRHHPSHHTTHTRYSPAVHMGLTHLCKQRCKRQKTKPNQWRETLFWLI